MGVKTLTGCNFSIQLDDSDLTIGTLVDRIFGQVGYHKTCRLCSTWKSKAVHGNNAFSAIVEPQFLPLDRMCRSRAGPNPAPVHLVIQHRRRRLTDPLDLDRAFRVTSS